MSSNAPGARNSTGQYQSRIADGGHREHEGNNKYRNANHAHERHGALEERPEAEYQLGGENDEWRGKTDDYSESDLLANADGVLLSQDRHPARRHEVDRESTNYQIRDFIGSDNRQIVSGQAETKHRPGEDRAGLAMERATFPNSQGKGAGDQRGNSRCDVKSKAQLSE
jgi:hypothetical protein